MNRTQLMRDKIIFVFIQTDLVTMVFMNECVQRAPLPCPLSQAAHASSCVCFRIKIEEEYAKNLSKLSLSPLAAQEEGWAKQTHPKYIDAQENGESSITEK